MTPPAPMGAPLNAWMDLDEMCVDRCRGITGQLLSPVRIIVLMPYLIAYILTVPQMFCKNMMSDIESAKE